MIKQRQKLLKLWFAFACICAAILLLMSFTERTSNGDEVKELWLWLSVLLGPTLALMISTFVKQEQTGMKDEKPASPFLFKICFWTSLAYLAIPLLGLLTFPAGDAGNPIEWLQRVTIINDIAQPVLFAALGYFFYGDFIKEKLGGDTPNEEAPPAAE